jgi:hypothetical protein
VNSQMPMKPFGVHDFNRYSELPKEKKAHVIFSMGIMNTQHERPTLFSFVHRSRTFHATRPSWSSYIDVQ